MTHVDELLARSRDGDLSYVEGREVKAHLADCARCRALGHDLERNDRLIARREEVHQVARFDTIANRGPGWLAGAAIAAAAIALAFVIARLGAPPDVAAPGTTITPSPAPSPSATASPAATSTPVPSGTAGGGPTAQPATGVTGHGLGPLRGDHVFAVRERANFLIEIWDIPLAGTPRVAVSFTKARGGAPSAVEGPMTLRQQFSPTGTELVVSGPNDVITVVELESGRARTLDAEARGSRPSWSPDGAHIAFWRANTQVEGGHGTLWVVPAAGGPARQLGAYGPPLAWSPDGARVVVPTYEFRGLVTVDVRTEVATVLERGDVYDIVWRTPGLALAVQSQTDQRLDFIDTSGARRTVHSVPALHPDTVYFHEMRFDPASGSEILHLVTAQGYQQPHVVDLATGIDTIVPVFSGEATWTPDGGGIVFFGSLERALPTAFVAMYRVDRDGTNARELMRIDRTTSAPVESIASVRYGGP